MQTLDQWRAYFAAMPDSSLQSAWNLWGQSSESESSPRLMNAWQAVNEECFERGLLA